MKVMIAVPTADYVNAEFMRCLTKLCIHLAKEKVDFDLEIISGTLVYVARNRLAYRAIREKYTHVLWLDSDMTFGENILDDLSFCGKDVVCGAFVSRRPPFGPCVYTSIADPANMKKVENFGSEPFRVDGCGMAAVLTSVKALKTLLDEFGSIFTPMEEYGEDLAFCNRLKRCGIEIWCEPTVRPGHIAHIPVYAGEYLFGDRTEEEVNHHKRFGGADE